MWIMQIRDILFLHMTPAGLFYDNLLKEKDIEERLSDSIIQTNQHVV